MKWLTALALLSLGFAMAGEPAKTTLTGSYVWNHIPNEPGNLKAVFTPKGEKTYDVAFYFKFDGVNHVYSGTATGSLEDGNLEGKVKNENKRRTFTFSGTCKKGSFSGVHSEIGRSGEKKTGTLTLAAK
ncbi:hypothetical protein [Acanthopleuribacter pedis]|uniref:Uncharacterized protein n=1 Tax=Acanthopleuribacter pedis TaxID=442870 RepID=A0A8J7QEM5_9BACT|nr:hypothetical protein [Acanthopleuribacter pedis]MBO1323232.1 hypothetical protein [Acanthopleuribacter pedis]